MKYKFEEFSDIIIDPIITIGNEIIINKEKNTCSVNVILMPTNRGIIFELPFNGLESIESQVNNKLAEFEYNGDTWHEDTNFQIKFTTDDLLDMIESVPQMADYTNSLTTYRDMMHRIFYVNFF